MDYKIGDRIKFLNDIGGGEIIELVDKNTVVVLTDDGFEFPHSKRDIIKADVEITDSIFAEPQQVEEKPETIQQKIDSSEPTVIKEDEEVNIFLSFVPTDAKKPTESKQEMFLVNDSNWNLMYVYQIRKDGDYESFEGVLQPNYIENLTTFELSEINKIKDIIVQIIFYRKTPYDIKKPAIKHISINPQSFYKINSFVSNDFFDDKAISFPVVEENPLAEAMEKFRKRDAVKIISQKEIHNKNVNKPKEFIKPKKIDIIEFDLHLIELLDDTKGMSQKEMLDYQIDTFKEELKKAQKTHHIKKIVFIHGKGKGSLKMQIRSFLDINKIKYQDASFQKYGFGATLVFV